MFKKICFLLAFLSLASISIADTVTLNPDRPDEYVVQKGDTLWDISARFLQEPWYWPTIWQGNPQIEDPHLIYPGDVVSLKFKDGQPMLTVNASGMGVNGRNVKLSPVVRYYDNDDAIPSIPVDAIQQFLTRPRVVTDEEMDKWPYVISSYDQHLISGAGNKLYVRGLSEDSTVTRYGLYRKGPAYINPRKDKDKVLGYEALYLGDVVIEKRGDPASVIVTLSKQEILNGDRLVAESDEDASNEFTPSTPYRDIDANILSVFNGVAEIGQYQVVVVDVGDGDGVEVGSILAVYQSGTIVKDEIATEIKGNQRIEIDPDDALGGMVDSIRNSITDFENSDLGRYLGRPNAKPELIELPEEYAGVLMIFRIFENVSYALVMKAVSPIHVLDSVRNL
ncbi:MAG: LysM peptidoglycan-binding domain-containing protein [Proteobacteria bacterium]|nr:LysM peptidoglycan-binding domain-containing protein [Pseudomonadota bacterium]